MTNKFKFETLTKLNSVYSHQWKQPLNILSLNNTNLELMGLTNSYSKNDIQNIIQTNKIALDFIVNTLDGLNQYTQLEKQNSSFSLKSFLSTMIENFNSIKTDSIDLIVEDTSADIEIYSKQKTLEFALENIFLKLTNFPINQIDIAITTTDDNLKFTFTSHSSKSLEIDSRIIEHMSKKELSYYSSIGFEFIELAISTILNGQIEIKEIDLLTIIDIQIPLKA